MEARDIIEAAQAELKALGVTNQELLREGLEYAATKARELQALRGDPNFDVAAAKARGAIMQHLIGNGTIAADKADDAAWNASMGITLRVLSLAV